MLDDGAEGRQVGFEKHLGFGLVEAFRLLVEEMLLEDVQQEGSARAGL